MKDDKSIASYNIKDGATLTLVVRRPVLVTAHPTTHGIDTDSQLKAAPAAAAAIGSMNNNSAVNSPRTAPQAVPSFSAPRPPAPVPAAPTIPTAPGGPAFSGSGLSSNAGVSEAHIEQIMSMNTGHSREDVVRALRASFDHPDQAVEFLFTVRGPFFFPFRLDGIS